MHCATCRVNITDGYFEHLMSERHKKNYFHQAFEEEKEPILKIVDQMFDALATTVNA